MILSWIVRGEFYGPNFSSGLVKVRIDGKYGFVNTIGEQAIPAVYDSTETFTNGGLSIVSKGKKWGVINKEGDTVIDLIYDGILEMSKKGYIIVMTNGVAEIIDYSCKILSNDELENRHKRKSK